MIVCTRKSGAYDYTEEKEESPGIQIKVGENTYRLREENGCLEIIKIGSLKEMSVIPICSQSIQIN